MCVLCWVCVSMNIQQLLWLICRLFVQTRKTQDVPPKLVSVCRLLNGRAGTDPRPFAVCPLCLRRDTPTVLDRGLELCWGWTRRLVCLVVWLQTNELFL